MARVVMSQELARFIVRAAALAVAWAFLTDALNVPAGWWFMGQLVLSTVLLANYRIRLLRASREPARREHERLGPPLEWID